MTVRELFARLGLRVDRGSFARGDRALQGIRRVALAAASAVGVTLGVRGFGRMIAGSVQAGDALDKLRASTGLTTDFIQEMTFAAEQNGVSQRTMESGLQRATRRLAQAADGHGAARRAVEQHGIQVRDANGRLRDQETLIEEVSDVMRGMESEAERLAFANQIFGREAEDVARVLGLSREELAATREEAHALGGVMSEELIAASAELADNQGRLSAVGRGLRNLIAAELVPAMNDTAEAVLAWVQANGDLLRQRVSAWTRDLVSVLSGARTIIMALVDAFRWWFGVLRDLEPSIGRAGVFVTQLATAFGVLAAAIGLAQAAALAKVAIIGAIIWLIADTVNHWESLVEAFEDAEIDPTDNPFWWALQQLILKIAEVKGEFADFLRLMDEEDDGEGFLEGLIRSSQQAAAGVGMAIRDAEADALERMAARREAEGGDASVLRRRAREARARAEEVAATQVQASREGGVTLAGAALDRELHMREQRRRAARSRARGRMGPAESRPPEEMMTEAPLASLPEAMSSPAQLQSSALQSTVHDNRRTEIHVDARGAQDEEAVRRAGDEGARRALQEYDERQRQEVDRDLSLGWAGAN